MEIIGALYFFGLAALAILGAIVIYIEQAANCANGKRLSKMAKEAREKHEQSF